MTMEKYGVSDKVELMKEELAELQAKLVHLRSTDEKTASIVEEIVNLQEREGFLIAEINRQS
jgi:hypothetical protein